MKSAPNHLQREDNHPQVLYFKATWCNFCTWAEQLVDGSVSCYRLNSSVSLQWASRVTASHSCWLQHTSFQHMTSSWHHEFTHLHHDWQQTGVILRDCWGRQITHDASFYIMGQFCGAYIFYLKFSTQIWFFLLHYSYLMTLELLLCECMMHQSQSSFNKLTFSQIGLN